MPNGNPTHWPPKSGQGDRAALLCSASKLVDICHFPATQSDQFGIQSNE